jgi:molybdopterin/thiamine biosynthesis adenylyltransferase
VNADARLQNELILAMLLGEESSPAVERVLEAELRIEYSPGSPSQELAAEILETLLSRTVKTAARHPGSNGLRILSGDSLIGHIAVEPDAVCVQSAPTAHDGAGIGGDRPFLVVGCCYAAAFVVARLAGERSRLYTPDPLVIRRADLPRYNILKPINLGNAWLLGAGAIGCGVLYALQGLRASGTLNIVDPKQVKGGNLNRQVLYRDADLDRFKAEVAADWARAHLPDLEVRDHVAAFDDLVEPGRIDIALTALDTREGRQNAQLLLPGRVFDSSTTGAREVIVYQWDGRQASGCLACAYPTAPDADLIRRHVAAGLGLTESEAARPLIDEPVAHKLAARFVPHDATAFLGRALSSVYREQCAAQVLATPAGEQFLAPLAFVSVLAGTLQVMHLLAAQQGERTDYQWWPISAWRPPLAEARRRVRPALDCRCQTEGFARAMNGTHTPVD